MGGISSGNLVRNNSRAAASIHDWYEDAIVVPAGAAFFIEFEVLSTSNGAITLNYESTGAVQTCAASALCLRNTGVAANSALHMAESMANGFGMGADTAAWANRLTLAGINGGAANTISFNPRIVLPSSMPTSYQYSIRYRFESP